MAKRKNDEAGPRRSPLALIVVIGILLLAVAVISQMNPDFLSPSPSSTASTPTQSIAFMQTLEACDVRRSIQHGYEFCLIYTERGRVGQLQQTFTIYKPTGEVCYEQRGIVGNSTEDFVTLALELQDNPDLFLVSYEVAIDTDDPLGLLPDITVAAGKVLAPVNSVGLCDKQ